MAKLDADKAFQLAATFQRELQADTVILFAFSGDQHTCDIVGEAPPSKFAPVILRRVADQMEGKAVP
jgi:hypothetical protein